MPRKDSSKQKITFSDAVYQKTKLIPRGKVSTYGEIARALENPRAARAVGNALNRNPYAPVVPCHRIVAADGKIGGFAGGEKAKIKLLAEENVLVKNGKVVDFQNKLFRFRGKSDANRKVGKNIG